MTEVNWNILAGLGDTYNRGVDQGQKQALNDKFGALADSLESGAVPGTATPGMTMSALGGAPSSASGPSVARASVAPIDPKSIPSMVQSAGTGVGIAPDYLQRLGTVESRWNPNAHNPSGADGVFQFMPKTWAAQGLGGSPRDPATATMAAANLSADNADQLATALGREPTQGETYLAHQQGLGGALALLKNPGLPAVDALAQAYGGDTGKAARALASNGGTPGMTAGDFSSLWTGKFPSSPVRLAAGADPDTTASIPPPVGPGASPIALGGNASTVGSPMTLPAAAMPDPSATVSPPGVAAPGATALDAGSLFRLTNGAKANPDQPATSFVGRATIAANRDLFLGSDGKPKSVGDVVASLNPTATPASPAAAASAAPSPAAPAADPLVVVPGINGGKPINRAWVDAQKNGTDVPDDGVLEAIQAKAGGAPAAAPVATAAAATPSVPTDGHGPGAPGAPASAGLPPPPPAPVQSAQARSMIALMLRDPATRGAGLTALSNLSTKAANPPFMYNGSLMQYGADGSLKQVVAAKDLPDEIRKYQYSVGQGYKGTFDDWTAAQKPDATTLVENADGTRSLVNKTNASATPVTGLPQSAGTQIWGTPGKDGAPIQPPPGTPAGTPGYYDAKGVPHVALTSGTNQADASGQKQGVDLAVKGLDGSLNNITTGTFPQLKVLDRLQDNLNNGMYNGGGATMATQIAGYLDQLGFGDHSKLANTQEFLNGAAQDYARLARSTFPQRVTNADLNVAKIMAGTNLEQTKDALQNALDVQRENARMTIAQHNAKVDRFGKAFPNQGNLADMYRVDPEEYNLGANPKAPLPNSQNGGSGPDQPTAPGANTPAPGPASGSNPGATGVAPPGQRVPIPQGYNAARVVSDAQAAVAAHPELKAAIAAKLNAYGIPSSVLGN